MSHIIFNFKLKKGQNKGQIVVEYVLLLLVAVSIAALMVSLLINRGEPENQGVVIKAWNALINLIRSDRPDDVAP